MKTIKELMNTKIIRVDKKESILAVAKIMSKNRISCILVLDGDKPIGIVTERDMIKKVIAKQISSKIPVEKIMTKPLKSVSTDTSFESALDIMTAAKIRRLVVTEGGQVVGLVTQTDVLKETKGVAQKNNLFQKYQNIQSYTIIGIAVVVIISLIFMYFFK